MSVIKSKPEPVDIHVGSRVRLRRTLLGMSQDKLGKALSLTFQQIQKYERGANRIGSSKLYKLSQVLDVPVSFFFDDMPEEITGHPNNKPRDIFNFSTRKNLELMRDFSHLTPHQKKSVHDIVRVINGANIRRQESIKFIDMKAVG
ncbi:MAG: helix-turn-helix transcriptional regulator [Emcibacter sp.]|nr:helix-turn-helix transcriptional regulator [Emcibacter sp.]